jgi:Tfp pilus assembly protein PilX
MKLGVAPAATGTGYRITAHAVGSRPETVVILQSMYTVR